MTVDELGEVIQREFDSVHSRLDKFNGKVDSHDRDLTGLKVQVAYYAGGAIVIATVIGWVLR